MSCIMFTHFDEKEKAIHCPPDRRMYVRVVPKVYLILIVLLLATFGVAWAQYLIFGLPDDPSKSLVILQETSPSGFPTFIIICHWANFFLLFVLLRSGLSILMDHPRLYWNNGCTPNSEWARFTPIKIPGNKLWTAKDDARYLNPFIGLPGYRHTVGIARGWHFIHVPFFVLNGLVFITLLFAGNQWQRIVPTSFQIFPDAWAVFVHYATFNMPVEPDGFYYYNALQKLSYFGVVFILAPLAILTGMCMSPAIENRFHWLPKLFGNRQGARSVHFLVMLSFFVFIIIHVSMVAYTGLIRNMNHITLGKDNISDSTGLYIGLAIILFTIVFHVYAHWVSWNRPRWVQRNGSLINQKLWEETINKLKPVQHFEKKDISPYFWPNGKLPTTNKWQTLAANHFKDYKLKIGGHVENPVELSIQDMQKMGMQQTITMHHCIQGWSGIAEWGGIPISEIVKLVKPHPSVTTVAFYSFGEGLFGGVYYDTHTLDNCLKPGALLAWEMNYKPLPEVHGAPLRLRIENQLGYKMVKWIERIEFIETHKVLGKGYGGKNEDDEYFDLLADT